MNYFSSRTPQNLPDIPFQEDQVWYDEYTRASQCRTAQWTLCQAARHSAPP